ncbi:MAG: DUF2892 domain-containing protein [Pseudomonadota bacterium]
MTTNLGTTDRILRIVIGLVLIALAVTGTLGAWAYIGVVPLVTAFVKFCPAYALIGLRTCRDQ